MAVCHHRMAVHHRTVHRLVILPCSMAVHHRVALRRDLLCRVRNHHRGSTLRQTILFLVMLDRRACSIVRCTRSTAPHMAVHHMACPLAMVHRLLSIVHHPPAMAQCHLAMAVPPSAMVHHLQAMALRPLAMALHPLATLHRHLAMAHLLRAMVHRCLVMAHRPLAMVHSPPAILHGPQAMAHRLLAMAHRRLAMALHPLAMALRPLVMEHRLLAMVHPDLAMAHPLLAMAHRCCSHRRRGSRRQGFILECPLIPEGKANTQELRHQDTQDTRCQQVRRRQAGDDRSSAGCADLQPDAVTQRDSSRSLVDRVATSEWHSEPKGFAHKVACVLW